MSLPRVLFMGSPEFAVPSLRALVAAGYPVVAAVSQPDRPAGRGGKVALPPTKEAAIALAVPTFQPESLKDPAVQEALRAFQPELFVVAAYGKILPRAVLAIPERGSVNVHASLLPRWRGASPIAAAIRAGDPETGVSIMEMAPKMDAGPVISQARTPILPTDTTGTLEPRLAALGARTLVETLPRWLAGELPAVAQDEAAVTFCSLIAKSDGFLSRAMSAIEAERAVRAFSPWPGAGVEYRGERLAIWRAHLSPASASEAPGTLVIEGRLPAIHFPGALLVLDEVQKPGSRRLPGEAFLNGERGRLEAMVTLA